MPVIEYTLGGPTAPLSGWPVNITFTTPSIPLPALPKLPGLGLGAFDFGIKITFICPGQIFCHRRGSACQYQMMKVKRVDLNDFISIKSLQLPQLPKFPTWTFNVSVPPITFTPLNCPNLPKKPS